MVTESHWVAWHRIYEIDGSPLQQRLAIVQRHLVEELDRRPAGEPIQILSLCAGQGRDVIGALAEHPARHGAHARLVEFDPQLVADARKAVADRGLAGAVDVVEGDASTSDCCDGAVPADVVVACGIFGNISDTDIRAFVEMLPMLCAPRALVVWTRHRREPDLTVDIREWFAGALFEELAFESPDTAGIVGVGVHRFAGPPAPYRRGVRLFTFVGDGS